MVVFPNAKINLGLHVVEKREDRYHNIETCFYPVQWHDALEIIESKKTHFTNSGINIPGLAKENLCYKAYELLRKDFGLPDLQIHLHKIIPIGAGLGGGSSDAAFTLRLLSEQFHLMLDDDLLTMYATQLGSDCAFFIQNRPCLATGKGEILEPLTLDLSDYHLMLVYPEIHISTQEAYADIEPKPPSNTLKEILLNEHIQIWREKLINDFEHAVFQKHPELQSIKDQLYAMGAIYAAMSGSGSGIYGIFQEEQVSIFPEHYMIWQGQL